MMRRRGAGRDLQPIAEINVTSMVDVAFTLLIIFIITAPILQGGIEVAVPQTDVSSLTADENSLIITWDRDGVVYLGETPMDRTEFHASFPQIAASGDFDSVWLKGDSLSFLGGFIDLMGTIQAAGFAVKIVAEQRPRR